MNTLSYIAVRQLCRKILTFFCNCNDVIFPHQLPASHGCRLYKCPDSLTSCTKSEATSLRNRASSVSCCSAKLSVMGALLSWLRAGKGDSGYIYRSLICLVGLLTQALPSLFFLLRPCSSFMWRTTHTPSLSEPAVSSRSALSQRGEQSLQSLWYGFIQSYPSLITFRQAIFFRHLPYYPA